MSHPTDPERGPWPIALDGPLGAVERVAISSDDEEGQHCGLEWHPAGGWFATSNHCTTGADCPWRLGRRHYPVGRAAAERLAALVVAALPEPGAAEQDELEDLLGWDPEDEDRDDAFDDFAAATSDAATIDCADGRVPLPVELADALVAAAEAVRDAFAGDEHGDGILTVSWLEVDGTGWMVRCEPHGVVERLVIPRGADAGTLHLLGPERRRDILALVASLPAAVRDEAGAARWAARLGSGGQPEAGRLIQVVAAARRYHAAADEGSSLATDLRALVAMLA